jgi:membrane protein DedA with SNARE-associated domain
VSKENQSVIQTCIRICAGIGIAISFVALLYGFLLAGWLLVGVAGWAMRQSRIFFVIIPIAIVALIIFIGWREAKREDRA